MFLRSLSVDFIRDFQQEFTQDLPKIYPKFTQDLPKINAFSVFYILKNYPRFTKDLLNLPKAYPGVI